MGIKTQFRDKHTLRAVLCILRYPWKRSYLFVSQGDSSKNSLNDRTKLPLTENSIPSEVLLILEHLAEGVLVFAVPNPQNQRNKQHSLGELVRLLVSPSKDVSEAKTLPKHGRIAKNDLVPHHPIIPWENPTLAYASYPRFCQKILQPLFHIFSWEHSPRPSQKPICLWCLYHMPNKVGPTWITELVYNLLDSVLCRIQHATTIVGIINQHHLGSREPRLATALDALLPFRGGSH